MRELWADWIEEPLFVALAALATLASAVAMLVLAAKLTDEMLAKVAILVSAVVTLATALCLGGC